MSDRQTGRTASRLAECITNLALGKRVYFVVHELQFARYCADLCRHIAWQRGFQECRMKNETTFALKNGAVELRFISINNPNLIWKGFHHSEIVADRESPVFVDHHAPWGKR